MSVLVACLCLVLRHGVILWCLVGIIDIWFITVVYVSARFTCKPFGPDYQAKLRIFASITTHWSVHGVYGELLREGIGTESLLISKAATYRVCLFSWSDFAGNGHPCIAHCWNWWWNFCDYWSPKWWWASAFIYARTHSIRLSALAIPRFPSRCSRSWLSKAWFCSTGERIGRGLWLGKFHRKRILGEEYRDLRSTRRPRQSWNWLETHINQRKKNSWLPGANIQQTC